MTNKEQAQLDAWRAAMLADLQGSDIWLALRALLALTYDDPDRRRIEVILLDCLSLESDPQIRALAVTCMGHLGRIHHAVSADVKRRLEGLLDDPILGGTAEDALDDIEAFANGD